VQLIPLADETQGVQVKLCYPLTLRVCGSAIQIDYLYNFSTNSIELKFTRMQQSKVFEHKVGLA